MDKKESAISQRSEMKNYGLSGNKGLKNSGLVWVFTCAVAVTILIAFNNQSNQKIPLSEIFPEQEVFPVDVEYEFVDENDVQKDEKSNVNEDIVILKEDPKVEQKAVKIEQVVKKKVEAMISVPAKKQESNSYYGVQVSSFKSKKRARQDVEQLSSKGYQAYTVPMNLGSKGVWHRVYIGKFDTRGRAFRFMNEIKKDFKDGLIRKIK